MRLNLIKMLMKTIHDDDDDEDDFDDSVDY